MARTKAEELLARFTSRADANGTVGGFPRSVLTEAFHFTDGALASMLSKLVAMGCLKNITPGTRERLGFYRVTGKAYQPEDTATRHAVRSRKRPVHAVVRDAPPPEPEPKPDTGPFTSSHLKALGIEVVTRLRPDVAFCSPTGLPRLLPISLPRVRCLEVPA